MYRHITKHTQKRCQWLEIDHQLHHISAHRDDNIFFTDGDAIFKIAKGSFNCFIFFVVCGWEKNLIREFAIFCVFFFVCGNPKKNNKF